MAQSESIHFQPELLTSEKKHSFSWQYPIIMQNLTESIFDRFSPLFNMSSTGEMIISNDRYSMNENESSMYAVQMTLVIQKLHKADMGGYKCISKNSIGDAEGTIRLYGKYGLNRFTTSCRSWACSVVRSRVCGFLQKFKFEMFV